MSFWKNNAYPYIKVTEINEGELILLRNGLNREDMIEWLIWNDPNGIYSDEQSFKEFGNVMSRDEGMEIMLRQAKENRVVKFKGIGMITRINTLDDVKIFVIQLVEEGLNYHPDDDFTQYINIQTDEPTYSLEQAALRNELNNQCFDVCDVLGVDIYDVTQEVFLIETGLDKYIPLPSQVS